MKKTTIRLDDQIHTLLVRLAEQRGVSLNHLINYALVRFVSFEEAFEMLEDRAHRAQSGAIKRALQHATAHAEPPLHPEDHIPQGFDRHLLERRIAREAALHTNR
jgi:uncharacterized protein (DUF927 family)